MCFSLTTLTYTKFSLQSSCNGTAVVMPRFSPTSSSDKNILESHEHSCDCHFPAWHIKGWTGDLQNEKRDMFLCTETSELGLPAYSFCFSCLAHRLECSVLCCTNTIENKVQNTANWMESSITSEKCVILHFPSKHPRSNAPGFTEQTLNSLTIVCRSLWYDTQPNTNTTHRLIRKIKCIQVEMFFTEGAPFVEGCTRGRMSVYKCWPPDTQLVMSDSSSRKWNTRKVMVISAANPLSKHGLIGFICKANFHLSLLTYTVQHTHKQLLWKWTCWA